ncbi:uncharacterized protein LOC144337808 isoform X1 [Macaca mulatta]
MHRHGRRGAGPRLHAGAQKPSVFMARPRAVLSQASTTAHRQASLGPRVWVPSLHHHHSEWNTAAGSSRHGPDLSLQHLGKPLTVWPRLAAYSLTLTSHHPRSRSALIERPRQRHVAGRSSHPEKQQAGPASGGSGTGFGAPTLEGTGSEPPPTAPPLREGVKGRATPANLYTLHAFYYKTTEHTRKIHHLVTTPKAHIFGKKKKRFIKLYD